MFWLLMFCCLLQTPPTRAPLRDSQASRPGTATIRGRVTDKETGVPVPRVVVRLVGQEFIDNPVSATTGDDGRYVLTGVPGGTHTLLVSMPPHRTMYLAQVHGDAEPLDPMRMSPPREGRITIADGETRDGVDVRLARALGISGRVINEYGEPMSDVKITLQSASGKDIQTSFRQTDDRGAFRLFNLRPGSYRVCANPTRAAADGGMAGDAPQPACYPADDEPGGLTLSTSDPPDIEIRIRRGRTFTISGTVVDASGAPASDVDVHVLKRAGFESYDGVIRTGGGRFRAGGLAPGDYIVQGALGREYDPLDTRERQVGVLHVRVESGDVDGLVLSLARGARVAGKLLVDDGPLPERTRLGVTAMYDDPVANGLTGPEPAAVVSDASTFELANIFGPVRFACAGLPPGWVVKAVRYQDQDITNRLTEFPAGSTQAVEIVVSSRGAGVVGSVSDGSGAPAPEGTAVLLIPAEYTGEGVTGMPAAHVTGDGTFKTAALRPGEYLVAAVDPEQLVPMIVAGASDLKARLSKVAQRIQLSEGERRTVDLRVVKIPEDR